MCNDLGNLHFHDHMKFNNFSVSSSIFQPLFEFVMRDFFPLSSSNISCSEQITLKFTGKFSNVNAYICSLSMKENHDLKLIYYRHWQTHSHVGHEHRQWTQPNPDVGPDRRRGRRPQQHVGGHSHQIPQRWHLPAQSPVHRQGLLRASVRQKVFWRLAIPSHQVCLL